MKKSTKRFLASRFSHVYVERGALNFPSTERVLAGMSDAEIVPIDNYKRLFNRRRQNFQLQKKSPKLILAVKRAPFLYAGSSQCQSFGNQNFFYTTPMLNCLYNCDYCYLQGLYDSANIVLFVNHQDFLVAARKAIAWRSEKGQPLYLSISYDTDLLAFEKITGYCQEWVLLAEKERDLLIELRTRSVFYSTLAHLKANERTIMAWSLSPQAVIKRYEKATPSLGRRLEDVREALVDGWPVRLCFDPVIAVGHWQREYRALVDQVFRAVEGKKIRDVAVGGFRMGKTHFDRIKKQRPDSDLFYGSKLKAEIGEVMIQALSRHVPEEKIHLWK